MKMHLIFIKRTTLRVTLVRPWRLPLGDDSLPLTPVAYGGKPPYSAGSPRTPRTPSRNVF
ncbi:hypothetical protein PQG02_12135 [Nostoc sp. UHCC 0926]|uniref:hypothetical protein n=1 Tax=Nostoc sp. TaxID=1180 RepID=UPI0027A6B10D|nr:hypothetical protein PQG02_12135 [Nostoc sp. UHCC 0926]